jgi:UDP-glucose 4-epimerase
MHYLVTGGAGFIGSNLTDALIEEGHDVTIVDNLSTGKEENINTSANFINADITNFERTAPHFEGIDGVFHAAALPRVQVSIEDPRTTHEANVTSTLNVLEAARQAGVKRVVYSASSSAYGNSEILPLHEELPISPMSPYGLHKYVGEEYCKVFSLVYNLETVSLRYFNVYGPRMADEGSYLTVIKTFLMQRVEGKPSTITGDGEQTRDFTHVNDVVRANILAMESNKVGRGEVINIGSGRSASVNQIADMIGGEKQYIPARLEPKDTRADITKAYNLLGWTPQENLEETIENLKGSEAI